MLLPGCCNKIWGRNQRPRTESSVYRGSRRIWRHVDKMHFGEVVAEVDMRLEEERVPGQCDTQARCLNP